MAPHVLDLLIDLTGPKQRQGFLFARKLRKRARLIVGRNAGFFRKHIYDRIFDEKDTESAKLVPYDMLERERYAQKQVLALAGVPIIPVADLTADRSKTIALDLPPMSRT